MPRSSRFGLMFALLAAAALAPGGPARAADVTVTLDTASGFVIEDNTGTLERLRVDEATGNVSRNGALFVHTTGTSNTFVGMSAGNTTTTGLGRNSAFGQTALSANTTGFANSAFGEGALYSNTAGYLNSAFGVDALRGNSTGKRNAAFGEAALYSNTTGEWNSAFGQAALHDNTTGISNSALGRGALRLNTTGSDNSAVGHEALWSNTTGFGNSAFGRVALRQNTTGFGNSAFGFLAMRYNTDGDSNSAFGRSALLTNTTGNENTAVGRRALYFNTSGEFNSAFGANALLSNTTGRLNAAFGWHALLNANGDNNIAIGDSAGINLTSGNENIFIGNPGYADDNQVIRIGAYATHTNAFIAGIHGHALIGSASAVHVQTSGELGIVVSSARFKRDVQDMGEASELLMALRPVTFRYREAVADGEAVDEYGLIAEEVAEVAPELVALDEEGQPYSVRYHVLPSLLLNETQKQQRVIEEQQQVIAELTGRLDSIEQQLAAESAGLDR